jgi:hypothetical protein
VLRTACRRMIVRLRHHGTSDNARGHRDWWRDASILPQNSGDWPVSGKKTGPGAGHSGGVTWYDGRLRGTKTPSGLPLREDFASPGVENIR